MSINNIFDVASRAMSVQMIRLNTTATNLANANSIASSAEEAFRPIRPVFRTVYESTASETGLSTVTVDGIVSLDRDPQRVHAPEHPQADEEGYIYQSAVNQEEEMVEMMDASRQYQNTLEVVSTIRTLMSRTMNMGQ